MFGLFLRQGDWISLSCVKEERQCVSHVVQRTLKFPTGGLRKPLEKLTLLVWCKICFILFSPQPDIQNLFHSPGKLHHLDKHKAVKRFPAAPVATVYSQAERERTIGLSEVCLLVSRNGELRQFLRSF